MVNKKRMLATIIFGLVMTISAAIIILFLIHRYHYAWTDGLLKCHRKYGSSRQPGEVNIKSRKLDYFTNQKVSYGFLQSDKFLEPIRKNPNYHPKNGIKGSDIIIISRSFGGGEYNIRFEYVYRPTDPTAKSWIYDGIGVYYFMYEECGVPYYQMEKNLRTMIDELPADEELKAEMLTTLSLNFSTDRQLIKIGF